MLNFEYKGISQGKYIEGEIEGYEGNIQGDGVPAIIRTFSTPAEKKYHKMNTRANLIDMHKK